MVTGSMIQSFWLPSLPWLTSPLPCLRFLDHILNKLLALELTSGFASRGTQIKMRVCVYGGQRMSFKRDGFEL